MKPQILFTGFLVDANLLQQAEMSLNIYIFNALREREVWRRDRLSDLVMTCLKAIEEPADNLAGFRFLRREPFVLGFPSGLQNGLLVRDLELHGVRTLVQRLEKDPDMCLELESEPGDHGLNVVGTVGKWAADEVEGISAARDLRQ